MLIDLTEQFAKRLRRKMEQKIFLDYADLELTFALEILVQQKDGCLVRGPMRRGSCRSNSGKL